MEFYPNNPSLGDELVRLFQNGISVTFDDAFYNRFDVEEEFKKNGRECDLEPQVNTECNRAHRVRYVDENCLSLPISNWKEYKQKRRQETNLRKDSLDDNDFYTTTSSTVANFKVTSFPKPLLPIPFPGRQGGECVFCRNNGEMRSCYMSHTLKDRYGKVTCPILRAYTCPICKVSGDMAHTVRYCPKNKNKEEYIPRSDTLKGFMRSSTGKKILFP